MTDDLEEAARVSSEAYEAREKITDAARDSETKSAAMMPKIHFPEDQGERLLIKPQSFDVAQRVEASAIATEKGVGLRMEVHSSHTEFWTDKTVPVGSVSVWMSKTYKGFIEPETVLESPETPWWPSTWSETIKKLRAAAQDSETKSAE